MKCNKKLAFTLAEVLITLGIIGVVAAITIPSLITNYEKKATITKLKKTYSELANAVKLSEAENGDISGWDISNKSEENFDTFLFPYMKASKKNYPAGSFMYKFTNGSNGGALDIVNMNTTVYTLLSGSEVITLKTNKTNRNHMSIVVDTNGVKQKPNRLGYDTFYMTIDPQLGFRMSQENQEELDKGTTTYKTRETLLNGPASFGYNCKNLGVWCGALIQRDGWEMKKDYPWK